MHNELENIIAKRQQLMDYCTGQTLNTLKTAIWQKAEVLSDNSMADIEGTEYARAVDELADIYQHCPAVRSIKDYMHKSDYLWDSVFIESIGKEEKNKWFHSHPNVTYDDFCKDNTAYDEALPYFSQIYKVIVNENYILFLKERKKDRDRRMWAVPDMSIRQEPVKVEDSVPASQASQTPTSSSFEHIFTDSQIDYLAGIINELHIFRSDDITSEQLQSIFDCKPIVTLKSKNNRLLAHLFDQLSIREYIVEDWQSVIARNRLFLSSQKDDYINQGDLSTAVSKLKEIPMTGKYAKIDIYIKNLKAY